MRQDSDFPILRGVSRPRKSQKAFPPTPPPPQSRLQSPADPLPEPPPIVAPHSVDPLAALEEVRDDPWCVQKIEWDITRASEECKTIVSALGNALLDSELICVSTKPKEQQTKQDRADAVRELKTINNAQGRAGGRDSFVRLFVDGFCCCRSGAKLTHVFDSFGNVIEMGTIDPICARPYYISGDTTYYNIDGTEFTSRVVLPSGIWYRGTSGMYTASPWPTYYQAIYRSHGRGAWIWGESLASENLQAMTLLTAMNQFVRLVQLGLDFSSVLLFNYIDHEKFFKRVEQVKDARKNKKKNPNDTGTTLVATQSNPDKEGSIRRVDLRGMPDGVDLPIFYEMQAAKLAKGFGVKASRTATLYDKARYAGSGDQAAMQESDEWGMTAVTTAYLCYVNDYLLRNKPFKVELVGNDDPKSRAKVAYELKVAQVASQLHQIFQAPDRVDEIYNYIAQRGVVGRESIGEVAVLQSSAKAMSSDPDEIDKSVEACAQDLNDLWYAFVDNDVPTLFTGNGVNEDRLNDELFYVASLLIAQAIRCVRSALGGTRDAYARDLERQVRDGLANLVGRPQDWTGVNQPLNPAYRVIRSYAVRIAVGSSTLADLQNALRGMGRYVDDYAAASRQANWYALGLANPGRVRWVVTPGENSPECLAYQGIYDSMADLLARTSGKLPGSLNLDCHGHCKCYLEIG